MPIAAWSAQSLRSQLEASDGDLRVRLAESTGGEVVSVAPVGSKLTTREAARLARQHGAQLVVALRYSAGMDLAYVSFGNKYCTIKRGTISMSYNAFDAEGGRLASSGGRTQQLHRVEDGGERCILRSGDVTDADLKRFIVAQEFRELMGLKK